MLTLLSVAPQWLGTAHMYLWGNLVQNTYNHCCAVYAVFGEIRYLRNGKVIYCLATLVVIQYGLDMSGQVLGTGCPLY